MRAREYLIEYNRQKTEQNYGDKIVMIARRDPTIPAEVRKQADNLQLVDIVLSQLERADPTKNKEYTQGLAKIYANGGLKMEDASSTLADYLAKFHKLKTKRMVPPPYNDFLRYTKVTDMMDVVDQLPDPDADTKQVDKGAAQEYYSDEQMRVIIPENETAACYYGQGTRWCTAAREHNMFDSYSSDGPLYIIIPKQPQHTGEKYQLHFESMQFMDEKDDKVSPQMLVDRFPSIRTAFAQQGKKFGIISFLSNEERNKLAEQGKIYIRSHGRDQGNGIVTVSLNEPNADVEDFTVNSRVANMVNAAWSRYDWDIPIGDPGEGNVYAAYAVIDTKSGSDDKTWIVWGEVDYGGEVRTEIAKYYTADSSFLPRDPTMKAICEEIEKLLGVVLDTGGDYEGDDPFENNRRVLQQLKQKYGT
jgi:hypothetical protein